MILGAFWYNLAYRKVAGELDPDKLAELRIGAGILALVWQPEDLSQQPSPSLGSESILLTCRLCNLSSVEMGQGKGSCVPRKWKWHEIVQVLIPPSLDSTVSVQWSWSWRVKARSAVPCLGCCHIAHSSFSSWLWTTTSHQARRYCSFSSASGLSDQICAY